jgi:hypothetical protein
VEFTKITKVIVPQNATVGAQAPQSFLCHSDKARSAEEESDFLDSAHKLFTKADSSLALCASSE